MISLSTATLVPSGLQASVKRLSGELVELKQHLEHYDKIQELTQMLQESHRCRGPAPEQRGPAPEQRGPACCSLQGRGWCLVACTRALA